MQAKLRKKKPVRFTVYSRLGNEKWTVTHVNGKQDKPKTKSKIKLKDGVLFNLRMPVTVHTALTRLAKKTKISASEQVRCAIRDYLSA